MSIRNQVTLIGHAGKDPEIHRTESGKVIAKFSLATNEYYRNANGDKVTETQWHNIVAWAKTAELIEVLIKKGSEVAVGGKLTYRTWEDKQGNKRYTPEVVINEFHLLSGGKSSNGQSEPVESGQPVKEGDDDLPF